MAPRTCVFFLLSSRERSQSRRAQPNDCLEEDAIMAWRRPRSRALTPTSHASSPSLADLSRGISPTLPVLVSRSYLVRRTDPIAVHYPLFFFFLRCGLGARRLSPGKKNTQGSPHIARRFSSSLSASCFDFLADRESWDTVCIARCAVGVGRHCGPGRDAGVFLFHITPLAT